MEALSLRLGVVEEIDSQAEAGRNEVIASNPTKIGCLAADQRWCVTRRVTEPDNFHGSHFTRTRLLALASVFVNLKPAEVGQRPILHGDMAISDAHRRLLILKAQKEVVSPHSAH